MTREDYIRALIVDKGFNTKSFAQYIGLPYSTLRSILSSGVGGASVDNAIKICRGLDISVDTLNRCGEGVSPLNLSDKEKRVVVAYRSHPSLHYAVDKLLGIEEVEMDAEKKDEYRKEKHA